jgi:hypothetical protein
LEKKKKLSGWSVGLHGRNRKYFHYISDRKWLCGIDRIALPTESAFNLGLAVLYDEIDSKLKCKKCLKIISESNPSEK